MLGIVFWLLIGLQKENFFDYVEQFISEETIFFGLSTNFLTKVKEMSGETEARTDAIRRYESNESFWLKRAPGAMKQERDTARGI